MFTFVTLLLLLNAQRRDGVRCDQDCYGTYRTYEPGHPWTNYTDAWQWDAQNALMAVAFIVAVAGVRLHARRPAPPRADAPHRSSRSCFSAAYLTWVQLSPPIGASRSGRRIGV